MNYYRRTISYAAAATDDDDGLKTSIATSTSIATYVPADFNGAVILTGGVLDLPRTLTITCSNNAGAFNATNPIVVSGRRGGDAVTENFTPPTTAGNAVLAGVQAFDTIDSIALPAQGSGAGTFKFGVRHICAPKGQFFSAIKMAADGTLNIQYGEIAGSPTDAIPMVIANRDTETIAPTRVLTGSGKTVVGVTLYIA